MKSKYSRRRALAIGTALAGLILLSACTGQPSFGPRTASGLPTHVDGGAGQLLRLCEKVHDQGDLTTAAAMCEKAHRLDPTVPEPLLELASILGEMNETKLSIEAYRVILKTSPGNVEAHYGLGRIYLSQGQNDLALYELNAALLSSPRDLRLYRAVGVANGLLGAHDQAQKVFRDGLEIAPEDTGLRNNLGLSLVQSGRTDQGLSILEALAKDPNASLASRDNLLLAQGIAAAEHAETMLAEARAKAEAEAQAAGQVKEQEKSRKKPVLLTFEPKNSWPMDGPGEVNAAPSLDMAKTADKKTDEARRSRIARILADRKNQAPTAPSSASLSAPIPLTKAMAAPQVAKTPARARPKSTAKAATPRSLASPMARQMARTDNGDTSDAGPGMTLTTPKVQRHQTAKMAGPGDYAVQFASYTSKERAWRGWDSLQERANDLLNKVEPEVRRADLGGDTGVVYRLRTGPIAQASAKTLCAALMVKNVDCLVVKSGSKVAQSSSPRDLDTL